jgi:O-antigen/teichoic acid export membrane protein
MFAQVSEASKGPKSRQGGAEVVRSILSNWGSYLIAMAINFFLSPYIVRHLGNTGYGVWTLILSLTGYLGLLDLGVRGAVTRYVAKFYVQANHDRASNIASSAMVIFASSGLIAVVISILLAVFVVGRLQIPLQYLIAARIVLILTGVGMATSLVNGVYGGVLVGLQRFDLTNSIEIGINLLRAGAIVLALYFGFEIVTLACIQLAFTLARWAANVHLVRHLYPELSMKLTAADRTGIKLIFSFSVFSFLIHISGSLIYATDNIVIGTFLPVSAVTFYVIGGNLVEYTRTIVGGISQTMTPLASSIEAMHDPERLQSVVLLSSRAAQMIVLPIALTFMLRGSSFIGLWMGRQYADLSGKVLWILSLTILFWAATTVTSGCLLGLSKHRPLAPVMLVEGLCNLALSVMWVKGSLGILGVAWGTVLPSLATSLLFWPWYSHRTLGISPLAYVVSSWVRPGVAIVPFALASYAIERYWPATHLTTFLAQVALTLPVAIPGYWLICLNRNHREKYSQKLVQSLKRVFARG